MKFVVSVLCCCWSPALRQFSINSAHVFTFTLLDC